MMNASIDDLYSLMKIKKRKPPGRLSPDNRAETNLPPIKKTRRRKQGPIMDAKNLVKQGLGALTPEDIQLGVASAAVWFGNTRLNEPD